MTRTHRLRVARIGVLLSLSFCLANPVLAQRADRATVSGVVTDAQNAPVPGATVTISNEATGVRTVQVTNAAAQVHRYRLTRPDSKL